MRKDLTFLSTLSASVALLLVLPACGRNKTQDAELAEKPVAQASGSGTASGPGEGSSDIHAANTPIVSKIYAPPSEHAPIQTGAGYGWDGERAVMQYAAPFERVVQAGLSALGKLGFDLDNDQTRRGQDQAVLVGLNIDKMPIEIRLKATNKGQEGAVVEAKVKVGLTGERGGAERVLDEIQKGLAGAKGYQSVKGTK